MMRNGQEYVFWLGFQDIDSWEAGLNDDGSHSAMGAEFCFAHFGPFKIIEELEMRFGQDEIDQLAHQWRAVPTVYLKASETPAITIPFRRPSLEQCDDVDYNPDVIICSVRANIRRAA